MIILNKIELHFGKRAIFDGISCNINRNSRIGLVGRNGSGKSTLLKVIAGQQGLDGGEISIEKNSKIAYMPQEVVLTSDKTIFQETLSAFGNVYDLLRESKELEKDLSSPESVERYSHIQHELIEHGALNIEVETKKILTGLGFGPEKIDQPVSTLSVGWRMRIVLAKLLLQKADFYLFDEPTNHLDIVTKEWFLHFLKNSKFGFMLVCHDRYFLDHLCTKTLELENGRGTMYHGNYTVYEEQKEERSLVQEQAAIKQQKELSKKMKTVERFRASASKAKMAQAMLKRIEKTERIEATQKSKTMAFSFPPVERSGKVVLRAEGLSHAFGEKQIFEKVSFEIERGERVAIVAPNGVGKTTLFNLITGRLSTQVGRVELGYKVNTALFEQDQDKVLSPQNTILQEVESACRDSETRQLVRKFLGSFLFSGDDVDKKVAVLSGGERNRVAMVKVLLQQANVLLLDEPTNHLDIQSKEILLEALKKFSGTIVFVSHDRDFLNKLATRILELSSHGVLSYPGNYDSYLYAKEKGQEPEKKKKIVKKEYKVSVDNKEKYELRRKISRLEGKIERLEKKIQVFNCELEKHEYGTQKFKDIYAKLVFAQAELDASVREWESLA